MRKASFRGRLLAPLCGGLLALCGCRSEGERRETLEALAVSSAIQALREAPHDDKAAALERLEAMPCTSPRAREAKELCAQAYALHQRSIDRTREIRATLAQTAAPPPGAAQVVGRAEKDLEAANRMMQECLRLETIMIVEARP
jgi:hypothetical protein